MRTTLKPHILQKGLICEKCQFCIFPENVLVSARLIPLNMYKPSSSFLTRRSKAVLLLWIDLLSLPYSRSLVVACPIGSVVCYVFFCFCNFPIWCPGSGGTRHLCPFPYFVYFFYLQLIGTLVHPLHKCACVDTEDSAGVWGRGGVVKSHCIFGN